METTQFRFKNEEYEFKLMGVFIAQIVKEGLTYSVERSSEETVIRLTGGF